ncbi:MAG: Cna domain protein, partial [Bryobacterales bacterium]|nr:Cna domain protein [Bryobacterales bacterium]
MYRLRFLLTKGFNFVPLILLLAAGVSFGQVRGTLNGKVTAASGGGVPRAAVTITNLATNERHDVVTGQDGNFVVADLAPGSYRISVEASGFKRLSQQDVVVQAGTPIRLALVLDTGSANETVEVGADASLIQDDSAQIGKSYSSRAIRELPLLDRNFQQLSELMTGVTPPEVNTSPLRDPQRNRHWATNGQPFWTNREQLDGVENDEPFFNIAAHVPAMETIQQLNFITGDYDASQGRAAGTIVNVISRSGTNQLHGSAFEFNNNSYFGARNYFNPKGLPQAHYNTNQFGATVGGRIIRDHTFFFLAYEGDYNRQQIPEVSTVPTASFLAGNFSGIPNLTLYNPATGAANGTGRLPFSNNIIPPSLFSSQASALLPYFPRANSAGIENNYFSNVPFRDDGNRADARIDHRFNDRLSAFLRWSYSNYRTVESSALGSVLGYSELAKLRAHNAMVGFEGTVFGMSADLRFGYTRYDDPIRPQTSSPLASSFGFSNPNVAPGTATLPAIQIGSLMLGTPANFQQRRTENNLNLASNWSTQFRGNNIRFGIDLWQVRMDGFTNSAFGPQGGYVFGPGPTELNGGAALGQFGGFAGSFASFLLGAPTVAGASTPIYSSNVQYQASGYVADTVHLLGGKLTLDLGLRYDFFSPLEPRHSAGVFIYDPASNQLLPVHRNGVDAVGNVQYNITNFAPRVGFAYRFTDRTVVRGGYGISYFNLPLQLQSRGFISQSSVQQGVLGGYTTAGSFGAVPGITAVQASGVPAPNSAFAFLSKDVQMPYVQSFNLQVQQDLTHGIVMDIGYVGNLGRQLPYTRNLNAAQPGTGIAGLPFFNQFGRTSPVFQEDTGLTSNYNALQLNITKRFSQGLAFTVAYTYSKALDYSDSLGPLVNNLDIRRNYGPADFDRTHVFTLTHVWQLPIGTGEKYLNQGIVGKIVGPWQLNGILRYATGTPFTPVADPAACACPGNTPVADVVFLGQTNVLTYQPTFFGYLPYVYSFVNYGFAQPAPGQIGNAGRNILRTENFINYDLALARTFKVKEQMKLDFRAEAYNLANSPHFGSPVRDVNSANFG